VNCCSPNHNTTQATTQAKQQQHKETSDTNNIIMMYNKLALLALCAVTAHGFTVAPPARGLSRYHQQQQPLFSEPNEQEPIDGADDAADEPVAADEPIVDSSSVEEAVDDMVDAVEEAVASVAGAVDDAVESVVDAVGSVADAVEVVVEDPFTVESEVVVVEEMEEEPPSEVEFRDETSTPLAQSRASQQSIFSLLQLAATTGRGEFATDAQHTAALALVTALELENPTPAPTQSSLVLGTWELVYSNTQLFRSSPFFMAGRAVCSTEDQALQYDWFCDMHRGALAISTIQAVRQIISPTRMVSEFEVKAGAVPFLSDFTPFAYSGGWPLTIDGAIVSSADITPTGDAWEVYMDTVEIKGSNLPGLRQVLDSGLKLQSRQLAKLLEDNISSYNTPKPMFDTTYLSENLRISRDQDGKVFVYTKVSEETEPTDYSNAMSDFGVSKLLEGFNDAVVKYYM